ERGDDAVERRRAELDPEAELLAHGADELVVEALGPAVLLELERLVRHVGADGELAVVDELDVRGQLDRAGLGGGGGVGVAGAGVVASVVIAAGAEDERPDEDRNEPERTNSHGNLRVGR